MNTAFEIAFEVIDIFSSLINLVTLGYVCKNYNIRIHVFTLLFLDSLSATLCSLISTFLDTIFLAKIFPKNGLICSWAFLVAYLPNSFGALLTLLIAVTRYTLSVKSAKNIHPSNRKVSIIALGSFSTAVVTVITFLGVNLWLGIPISYFEHACAKPGEGNPPSVFLLTTLFLFHPNFCNILTLITDINLLRFLRKVILPSRGDEIHRMGKKIKQE